jgi:hypothetical protein
MPLINRWKILARSQERRNKKKRKEKQAIDKTR